MFTQVAPLVAAQGTGSQLPQGPMDGIPMFPAFPMLSPATSFWNIMTKKRTRLTCDNLEELVFLHETWPVVREWEANKRVRMDEKAEQAVDLTNE